MDKFYAIGGLILIAILGIGIPWLFFSYLPKKKFPMIEKRMDKFSEYISGWVKLGSALFNLLIGIAIIAGIIYGIGAVINYIDWGFLNSEITAYPISCIPSESGYSSDSECNGKIFVAMTPITYKVYADQQYVVASQEESSIVRLSDCAIKDRQNWNCTEKNGYYTSQLGFTDGKYFDTSDSSDIKFVTKLEWECFKYNGHSIGCSLSL